MSVETAMSRIDEASQDTLGKDQLGSQRKAYKKTLQALKDIDADDDDEGIAVVTNYIVEQIRETGEKPSSRQVRKRAAKFCRKNGYEIRDDSWLGS